MTGLKFIYVNKKGAQKVVLFTSKIKNFQIENSGPETGIFKELLSDYI